MASLNITDPTMLDMVRRQEPGGAIDKIVEILSKKNPILQDAAVREGNLQTGHRFTTRNTEPALGWRRFNDGVVPSKSTTTQYDESCGMLEGFSRVDCGLAKLNGNEAAFRASEDMAFLSAMNREAVRALIYSSVDDNPEEIHGLSTRYDLLATANVVNGATYTGTTAAGNEQSSIWFVCWGDETTYLIYPKGMLAGLQSEDLAKQIVDAGSSKIYTAWVTHWMWNLGLCVQDRRQVARVCNLDSADINTVAEMALIVDAMVAAYYKLYDPTAGRLMIYTNRTIGEMLHRGAMQKASSQLTLDTYAGQPVTKFLGYPIRILDGMIATEAPLV
jgi:hypothetical protein